MGWCCYKATKKGEVRGLDESTKCGHRRPLLASGHLPTQHWFVMTMIASLLLLLLLIIIVVPDERLALFFLRQWFVDMFWKALTNNVYMTDQKIFVSGVSNNPFHSGLSEIGWTAAQRVRNPVGCWKWMVVNVNVFVAVKSEDILYRGLILMTVWEAQKPTGKYLIFCHRLHNIVGSFIYRPDPVPLIVAVPACKKIDPN